MYITVLLERRKGSAREEETRVSSPPLQVVEEEHEGCSPPFWRRWLREEDLRKWTAHGREQRSPGEREGRLRRVMTS